MKKYRIELSEEQMMLVANALEDISRFASGQTELNHTINNMFKDINGNEFFERKNEAESLLKQVKKVLLPELQENESKGYNGTEFIGNLYQIYRTILYQLAIDNNWNNVYSSPPLPSGNLGNIKITKID